MRFSEDQIRLGNFLYQEINSRLVSHLDPLTLIPKRILNLSLGGAENNASLHSPYPEAEFLTYDYFDNPNHLLGQKNTLPFENASFDLIYANLSLHWLDYAQQFSEWRRVLRENGVIFFSAFGPDSFQEYRQVWRHVGYDYSRPRFTDLHDLGDEIVKNGFGAPVMEMETITLTYQSSSVLIKDVRNLIGLPNGRIPDSLKLSSDQVKKALRALRKTSIEIVYGHAFAPFSIDPNDSNIKHGVIPIIKV